MEKFSFFKYKIERSRYFMMTYMLGEMETEALIKGFFSDKTNNPDDPRKFYTAAAAPESGSSGYWTEYNVAFHNNDWTFHPEMHLFYRFYRGNRECPVDENIN